MDLSFWFEFASTYSYPAAMRIEALVAQRGMKLSWRAFLISSPDTVLRCLAVADGDPAALLAEAQSPAAKERLRASTNEAISLGIFGAPSFVVGRELFWGHDRIEDALRWAAQRAA